MSCKESMIKLMEQYALDLEVISPKQ